MLLQQRKSLMTKAVSVVAAASCLQPLVDVVDAVRLKLRHLDASTGRPCYKPNGKVQLAVAVVDDGSGVVDADELVPTADPKEKNLVDVQTLVVRTLAFDSNRDDGKVENTDSMASFPC